MYSLEKCQSYQKSDVLKERYLSLKTLDQKSLLPILVVLLQLSNINEQLINNYEAKELVRNRSIIHYDEYKLNKKSYDITIDNMNDNSLFYLTEAMLSLPEITIQNNNINNDIFTSVNSKIICTN